MIKNNSLLFFTIVLLVLLQCCALRPMYVYKNPPDNPEDKVAAKAGKAISKLDSFSQYVIFYKPYYKRKKRAVVHYDFIDWLDKYTDRNSVNLILINDPVLGGDTAIWSIDPIKEQTFIPHNYNDVKNFAATFPGSKYLDNVILASLKIISKEELKKIILQFPKSTSIPKAKTELLYRSNNEKELKDFLFQYPDMKGQAEKKYSRLVRSYYYLLDYVKLYPKGDYVDSAVLNSMYEMSRKELLNLDLKARGYSEPRFYLSDPVKIKIQLALIEYCDSFNSMEKTIDIYPYVPFVVKHDATIDELDSVKAIYSRLMAYKPTVKKNSGVRQAAADLKALYIRNLIYSGNNEDIKYLLELFNKDEWLVTGLPTEIFDMAVQRAATTLQVNYFFTNGKIIEESKPVGNGKYYRLNGQISEGMFTDGKLNGPGKKLTIENDKRNLYEGNFVNDELNGEGKHTSPKGSIYKGVFKDDLLEGPGSYRDTFGNYDTGFFSRSRLEGIGKRKFNHLIYTGEFKAGKYDGEGKCQWLFDTAKWFTGHFTEGKRNGYGELHASSNLRIRGKWLNDCPDGSIDFLFDSQSNGTFSPIGTWMISNCIVISKFKDFNINEPDDSVVLEPIAKN